MATPPTAADDAGGDDTGDVPAPRPRLGGAVRVAAFLLAGLSAAVAGTFVAGRVQEEFVARYEVYVSPIRPTEAQVAREWREFDVRNRWMAAAGGAVAVGLLAAALGAAAGVAGGSGKRAAVGLGVGLLLGAAVGAAGGAAASLAFRSAGLAELGARFGEVPLFVAAVAQCCLLAPAGLAAGVAAKCGAGPAGRWGPPLTAGAAAGLLAALLIPLAATVLGSLPGGGVVDVRGVVRPVPWDFAHRLLLLGSFAALVSVALARASLAPGRVVPAPKAVPEPAAGP